VLNEDFRKLNANFNMTPSAFEKVAADIEIEFCLASMTPSGMPSNGVIRKQIQEPDIGLGNNYYSSSRGGSDGWDSERYINIWICELGPDVLGFATFPGMADPEESEGIVVQPHFFGREGTSVNSDPNHLGRTLTHEMGHYFGLEHLWGPDFGGCDEDDYIEDTPNQELETYFCPDFPVRDICSPQTPGIMFNNYMDYTDDECMTMFTADQKERMWSTLQIMRPRLMEGDLCTAVYVNSPRESSFVIMSNPFHKQFCIKPRINETAQIRIHSIHGQLVSDGLIQFYNNESMCISADDWEVGIYIATVNSPSVQTSFRLVKI
jgi:hypothetical protein